MNTLARQITKRTKALGQQGAAAKLHVRKWAEARRALQKLESVKGRTDPGLLRRANEYAADALGWKGYAPWLQVYSAVAGEFREGWLPDNYYMAVVAPRINGEYRRLSRLRASNRMLFGGEGFPDLAYAVNGIFYDSEFQAVPEEEFGAYLAGRAEALVFKADASGWGRGIRFIEAASLDIEEIKRLGNGVFQRRLVQNGFFDRFMPSSVATIRFATAIDDLGKASVRGCYLRLGRASDRSVLAHDQVRVAVDPQDGRLSSEGFLSDWLPVDRHPDTGQRFEGQAIPSIAKCTSTVLSLHAKSPQARCVSWDLVVDATGEPQVLEWEGGVVSFAEATQGPCFADLQWDRFHRE